MNKFDAPGGERKRKHSTLTIFNVVAAILLPSIATQMLFFLSSIRYSFGSRMAATAALKKKKLIEFVERNERKIKYKTGEKKKTETMKKSTFVQRKKWRPPAATPHKSHIVNRFCPTLFSYYFSCRSWIFRHRWRCGARTYHILLFEWAFDTKTHPRKIDVFISFSRRAQHAVQLLISLPFRRTRTNCSKMYKHREQQQQQQQIMNRFHMNMIIMQQNERRNFICCFYLFCSFSL